MATQTPKGRLCALSMQRKSKSARTVLTLNKSVPGSLTARASKTLHGASDIYTPAADEPQVVERSATGPSKRAADAEPAPEPVAAQAIGTDLAACKAELAENIKQRLSLESGKRQAESDLSFSKTQAADALSRLDTCTAQAQRKEDELTTARRQSEESQGRATKALDDCQRNMTELQTKLTSLERANTQAESDVHDARQREAQMRSLLEQCGLKAKKTDDEVHAARKDAQATKNELRIVSQKLKKRESKVAEIQAALSEIETGMQDKKRQWTSLTEELEHTRAKLAQQTLRNGELTSQKSILIAEQETARIELTAQANKHASLLSDLVNARREAEEQKQRAAILQNAINEQEQRIAEGVEKQKNDAEMLIDLKKQLVECTANLAESIQQRTSLESEKRQAERDLSSAKMEAANSQLRLNECTTQGQRKQAELATCQRNMSDLRNQLHESQTNMQDKERKLQEANEKLQGAATQNDAHEAQLTELNAQLQSSHATMQESIAEIEDHKRDIERLTKTQQEVAARVSDLERELERIGQEKSDLSTQISRLEEEARKNESAGAQKLHDAENAARTQSSEMQTLTGELTTQRAAYARIAAELSEMEGKLNNAERAVREKETINANLEAQLIAAQETLGESKQAQLLLQAELDGQKQDAIAAERMLRQRTKQWQAAETVAERNDLKKTAADAEAARLAHEHQMRVRQLEFQLTELQHLSSEYMRRANECETMATRRADENATMQTAIEALQTKLDDKNAERGRDALLGALKLHGIVHFWQNMEADFESALSTDFGKMHSEQIKEKAEELLVRVIDDLSSKCRLMNMHAIKSSMNPCLQCDELRAPLNQCLQCDDLRMKLADDAGRACTADIIKAITRHARELDRDMDDSKLLAKKASAATFLRMPMSEFTAAVKEISRTALKAFLKGATDTLTWQEDHSAFATDQKINNRVCTLVHNLNAYAHTFGHNPLDCRGATYRQMAHAMASRIYEYLQRLQQLMEKHSLPSFVMHDASASYGFPTSYFYLFQQTQFIKNQHDMASLTLDGRVDFVNFFYQRVYPQSKKTPLKGIKLRTSTLSEADVTYSSTSDAWKRIMEAIRMPSLDISTVTLEEFRADSFKMGMKLKDDTKRMLDTEDHYESRFPRKGGSYDEYGFPFFKMLFDGNGRRYYVATKENIGEILDIRMQILHHRAEKHQQHVASFASEMQKLFPAKEHIWSSVGMSIIGSSADSSWQDTLTTRVTRVTEEGSRPFDRGAIFQNAIDLAISDLSFIRSDTSSVSSAITRLATTLTDRHIFDIDSVRLKYLLQAVIDESKTS